MKGRISLGKPCMALVQLPERCIAVVFDPKGSNERGHIERAGWHPYHCLLQCPLTQGVRCQVGRPNQCTLSAGPVHLGVQAFDELYIDSDTQQFVNRIRVGSPPVVANSRPSTPSGWKEM